MSFHISFITISNFSALLGPVCLLSIEMFHMDYPEILNTYQISALFILPELHFIIYK